MAAFTMQVSKLVVLFFISAIRAKESGNHSSTDQCPQAHFLPSIPSSGKHCVYSDHCGMVECVVAQDGHKLTVILKINQCQQPLTATVTLRQPQSSVDWSHTFKDGEKAKLPVTPSMFSGGLPVSNASLFIQVGLNKTEGNNLSYKVAMVGHVTVFHKVDPVNVVLLQGKSPVWTGNCGTSKDGDSEQHPNPKHPDKKSHDRQEKCPPIHLDNSTECPVTNHCSTITCTYSSENSEHGSKVLIMQINGCREPPTVTIKMESSLPPIKWSHTFEDGEKTTPPFTQPGSNVLIKVELKKTNANFKFKLLVLPETKDKTNSYTLLAADLPLPKCGVDAHHQGYSSKWFSKQPVAVRVLVIGIPVVMLVLVGLGVAFCFYKNRCGGLRFPIHISQGGSKVSMQRLVNEV